MAAMLGNLYEALIEAGASPDKAQAAAEEAFAGSLQVDVTDLKSDMRLVKWMLGALLALNVAMFVNQVFT